jgi:hypothetical protein
MTLVLSNGKTIQQDSAGHVIIPTVDDTEFDIDDPDTWESDQACACNLKGKRIWKDGKIVTVMEVRS